MSKVRTRRKPDLGAQLKRHATSKPETQTFEPYSGNLERMTSTGSTLLDLAISGGVVRGGGMPSGILVEAFGPSSSGKTVLLCEVAGAIQRAKGEIMFHDPEARLNKPFAQKFDLHIKEKDYFTPNTVPEVFQAVRAWDVPTKEVNGVLTDSLAALSTDMEMETVEGDKMGQRRAKEFSQELRRTCRILKDKNYLMVCSNQIRSSMNKFGPKYVSPGGEAIGFYSSLRLRFGTPTKIKKEKKFSGKAIEKVIGIEVVIEVFKSSVDAPYRTAPLILLFDYGIDDIRANLQYVKKYTGATTYVVDDLKLNVSLDKSVLMVETKELETVLKEQVIDLWEEIESKFKTERKKKVR